MFSGGEKMARSGTIRVFCLLFFFVTADGFANADISIDSSGLGDYLTIQEGIDNAVNGETVVVAQGEYVENISFPNGKAIIVRSANPSDWDVVRNTIINGDHTSSCVVFSGNGSYVNTLQGFTITNGYLYLGSPMSDYGGGGIYCDFARPVISSCIITGNSAEGCGGGGIYCGPWGAPTISNCIISGNSTDYSGGGIYCYNSSNGLQINNCIIVGNVSEYGGGGVDFTESYATISGCIISGNSAYYGGGLECESNSESVIVNSIISGNWAVEYGGGLECYYNSTATIANTTIAGNLSGYAGSALSCDSDPPVANTVDMTNCILWDNFNWDDLNNCIWNGDNSVITVVFSDIENLDSVVSDITLPDPDNVFDSEPLFVIDGDDAITGNWTSPSSYNGGTNRTTFYDSLALFLDGQLVNRLIDPHTNDQGVQGLIVDNTATTIEVLGDLVGQVSAGAEYRIVDYHISNGSPCIDTGTDQGAPTSDIEGNVRPVDILGQGADETGTEYDIGAYEVQIVPTLPEPDIPDLVSGYDTGRWNNDNLTKLNNSSLSKRLQFSIGNTVNGAVVTIYSDGVPIGAALATSSTTIVTTSGVYDNRLLDGPHEITASQDKVGSAKSPESESLTVIVETVLPDISNPTVVPSGEEYEPGEVFVFEMTASDAGSGLDDSFTQEVTLREEATLFRSVNLQLVSGETNLYRGSWNTTYYIAGGYFAVDFEAVDLAGNSRKLSNVAFITMLEQSTEPGELDLLSTHDTGLYSDDDLTRYDNSDEDKKLQFSVAETVPGATVTIFADGDNVIGSAVAEGETTVVVTNGSYALGNGEHSITASQTKPGTLESERSDGLEITIDAGPPTIINPNVDPTGAHTIGTSFYFELTSFDEESGLDDSFTQEVTLRKGATTIHVDLEADQGDGDWYWGWWDSTGCDGGVYAVDFETVDIAGNVQKISDFTSITIILRSSTPGTPDLKPEYDTGRINNDNITRRDNSSTGQKLEFSVGNTVVDSLVTIYADGEPIGSAIADGSITYIVTVGDYDLSEGAHFITAEQVTPGYSVSLESSALEMTVDTGVPIINDASVVPTEPQFVGAIFDFDMIAIDEISAVDVFVEEVTIRSSNITAKVDLQYSGDDLYEGSWDSSGYKWGTYAVDFKVVDMAGNSQEWIGASQISLLFTGGTVPGDIGPEGVLPGGESGDKTVDVFDLEALAGVWLSTPEALDWNGSYDVVPDGIIDLHDFALLSEHWLEVFQSPPPAGSDLLAAYDTGRYDADDLTMFNNDGGDEKLQFSVGGTVAGTTVTIYAGDNAIGSVTATGETTIVETEGTYILADGIHSITATRTDFLCLESEKSFPLEVTVDTAGPIITDPSVVPVGIWLVGEVFDLTMLASDVTSAVDDLFVEEVIIHKPGTTVKVDLQHSGGDLYEGSWNSTGIEIGVYSVDFEAMDLAGNLQKTSDVASITIIHQSPVPGAVDLLAGYDTGRESDDDLTRLNNGGADKKLQFSVADTIEAATVKIYADGNLIGSAVSAGGATIVETDGIYNLSDGLRAITATQTEAGGNLESFATSPLVITVDTAGPIITDPSVVPTGIRLVGEVFDLTMIASDVTSAVDDLFVEEVTIHKSGVTIKVDLQHVAGDLYEGSWDSTGVEIGVYSVDFEAMDLAGNLQKISDVASITLVHQSMVPGVPDLVDAYDTGRESDDDLTRLNNSSPDKKLQFLVVNTINGATINIYADDNFIGSATAVGDTTIVETDGIYNLSDGLHDITATQTEAGGNVESFATSPLVITVDSLAPTITDPNVVPTGIQLVGEVFELSMTAFDADSGIDDLFMEEVTIRKGATTVKVNLDPNEGEINVYRGSWDSTGYDTGEYAVDFEVIDIAGNSQQIVAGASISLIGIISGDIAPEGGDGKVDIFDLSVLTQAWLSTTGSPGWDELCDIVVDGSIDLKDFAVMAQHWLEGT